MNDSPINKLLSITNEDNLEVELSSVADELMIKSFNLEAVESILKFMEQHPDWHLGSPGPLVHFVEKFYKRGYEELLISSIARRVTAHTAWMLNRIINGESDEDKKKYYISALLAAEKNPELDQATKQEVRNFLILHGFIPST